MISKILQMLPSFKGKYRLARFLLNNLIDAPTEIDIAGKYGCVYRVPNLKETVGFEILVNGIYEKDTVNFIVGHLKTGEIFLDIGANVGAISVPVGKRRADVKIICVEAAPWLFEYLKFNVKRNSLTRTTTINKAVSDEGQREIDFYSPKEKFGKGSLAPVFTTDGVKVSTVTLQELIEQNPAEQIGLIKIDVEGFESQVFLGGEKILKTPNGPDILFEFVDWAEDIACKGNIGAAQAILMEYGYSIYRFEENKLHEKLERPLKTGGHMLFATKAR